MLKRWHAEDCFIESAMCFVSAIEEQYMSMLWTNDLLNSRSFTLTTSVHFSTGINNFYWDS
jgi:hypothetical protein